MRTDQVRRRGVAARIEKTRRDHIRNAKELHWIVDRCNAQIKIVKRHLHAGRLALAVSELLFVEMYRTDALKLKLSTPSSMFRIRWLEGPVKRIMRDVILSVNEVAPVMVPKKFL